MADITIVKIKIRRGTDAQRKQIILDSGEIGYVSDPDARRLFVGDGVTFGGNPVGSKFFYGSFQYATSNYAKAQLGDIVYDTATSQLYSLTGINSGTGFPDYSNASAYIKIGVMPDDLTISKNGIGKLCVATNGISAFHISNDAFDQVNGFTRAASNAPFKLNIDNSSIVFNAGRQLTVNASGIDFSQIPITPPTPGSYQLWNDGGTLKVA